MESSIFLLARKACNLKVELCPLRLAPRLLNRLRQRRKLFGKDAADESHQDMTSRITSVVASSNHRGINLWKVLYVDVWRERPPGSGAVAVSRRLLSSSSSICFWDT